MSARKSRSATWIVAAALSFLSGIAAADGRAEQSTPPPIHGVTGTIASDESVQDVSRAGRGLLGKIARMFGLNRGDPVRSDDAAADEAFLQLPGGTRVIVVEATAAG